MSSYDFTFLTLRNIAAYETDGSPVTDNYVFTVSSGKQLWTNNLMLHNISASTLTSNNINFETMSGNTINFSTMYCSTITSNKMNINTIQSSGSIYISSISGSCGYNIETTSKNFIINSYNPISINGTNTAIDGGDADKYLKIIVNNEPYLLQLYKYPATLFVSDIASSIDDINYTLNPNVTILSYQTVTITNDIILTITEDNIFTNNNLIINNGTIINDGTIINNGTITNTIIVTNNALFENYGTFTNENIFSNNGPFTNHGTLLNTNMVDNTHIITNNCTVKNDGIITNTGRIDNNLIVYNFNGGVINSENGIFANYGTIKNGSLICGVGTIINLSGNPAINGCPP